MKASRPRVAHIGVLVGVAIAIYVAVYAIGSNSEPFQYAEAAIKASPDIHSMVGEVKDVSLKPLKGFRLTPRDGNRGSAHMSLHISGSKRDALITVQFRQAQGTWVIVNATIDDQQVNLH